MATKRPLSTDADGLGYKEVDPLTDELEVGDLSSGLPEDGALSAFGQGLPYTDGMVVITTDNTATSTTEGGNLTDVSADAASPSGSTFTFQGTAINHTILIGSEVDDSFTGDKAKHYGLLVKQTTAAVEITPRSFVVERWDGAAWTAVGILAMRIPEMYRYANEVFIRANSEEFLGYGIDSDTTWSKKTISTKNLFWTRIRVAIALTTVPVFEQFSLAANSSLFSQEGIPFFTGLAKFRETLFAAGNVFGETGGIIDASLPVGSGGLPTGWNHDLKNSQMNNDGDAIYFQFPLRRGIDTAFPLHVNISFVVVNIGTAPADSILSFIPVEAAGVFEADPTGGITPVARTLANTELLTAKAGTAFNQALIVDSTALDKVQYATFKGLDISNYYEGDTVFLRFEGDDLNNADIVVTAIELGGVQFTSGQRV
jgi:hypothetical protein